jgi:hypothetical protein
VLPYLINGEDIILDSLILDFDLSNNYGLLAQKLSLHNSTRESQRAIVAVPAYTDIKSYYDMMKISLDGVSVKPSLKFAETPNNNNFAHMPYEMPAASIYNVLLNTSIQAMLSELSQEDGYVLSSFDDRAPLSGYNYEITCVKTGNIRLILTYGPEETTLLIDPGDWAFEYNKISQSGQIYSRINGIVEISYYMEEGEKMNCRILILGNDSVEYELTHWTAEQGSNTENIPPGVEVEVSCIEGVTPFAFYNDYIHKYDYEDTSGYSIYKNELANRYIDRILQSGKSYIDCLALSYGPLSAKLVVSAILEFDIAAGETRCLEVFTELSRGFIVSDNRKTVDYYCPIFTEPLDSFSEEQKTEIIIKPPLSKSSISIMPELPVTEEWPLTFGHSGRFDSNIIIIYNTKYVKPVDIGLLMFIVFIIIIRYWPITLAIVIGIIVVIYKARKRKRGQSIDISA